MNDNKIIDLESKIAQQDFVIEKLTKALARQEVALYQLEETATILAKQIKDLRENRADIRGNEKPPHY